MKRRGFIQATLAAPLASAVPVLAMKANRAELGNGFKPMWTFRAGDLVAGQTYYCHWDGLQWQLSKNQRLEA